MWLRFPAAVAVVEASSCRADSPPSLGMSPCHRYGPKKEGKKKGKDQTYRVQERHSTVRKSWKGWGGGYRQGRCKGQLGTRASSHLKVGSGEEALAKTEKEEPRSRRV